MEKYFTCLRNCPLFDGINDKNLMAMLGCLGAKTENFAKNEIVFAEGEPGRYIGIVLSGTLQIKRTDYYGNRSIVTSIEPSELFGESFACTDESKLPFDVIASKDSVVLLIDCKKIVITCSNSCAFHNRMIFNLLKIVATKNIILNQKVEITSKRSTREKLMAYLHIQAKKCGSAEFTIPYDRQSLADYLEVDRSGLSAEISKLRDKKILESRKNYFKLL